MFHVVGAGGACNVSGVGVGMGLGVCEKGVEESGGLPVLL